MADFRISEDEDHIVHDENIYYGLNPKLAAKLMYMPYLNHFMLPKTFLSMLYVYSVSLA